MKANQWIGLCGIAAMLAGTAPVTLAQTTTYVYRVQTTLLGLYENDTPPPDFTPITFTPDDLVNLALGNYLTNSVPGKEILAFAVTVGENSEAQLAVVDTAAKTVLATIGTFDGRSVNIGSTKAEKVTLLPIDDQNPETNGLNGGNLMFVLTSTQPSSAPQKTSLSGTVTGWLDMTLTGSAGTQQLSVVFPKGTVSTKYVQTLINK